MSALVARISHDDFNSLEHIDTTHAYDQHDLWFIGTLGDIIRSHGLTKKFGISLLHKHFNLSQDELVVERSTGGALDFTVSCEAGSISAGATPSILKFSATSETALVIQWAWHEQTNEEFSIGETDRAALDELRSAIIAEGLEDRFGISVLHRVADIPQGMVMMEATDEDLREHQFTIEEMPADDPAVIGTQWTFGATGSELTMGCATFCHYNNGHRQRHSRTGNPT